MPKAADPTFKQSFMENEPKRSYSLVLTLVMLVIVTGVLLWEAHKSYREFEAYQQQIMQGSVNGTANEITLFVESVRTVLRVLAESQKSALSQLARSPENEQLYNKISDHISAYFPGYYYSFTIADKKGEVIYDDFGDKVGDRCRADIKKFATSGMKHGVYIHPGPFKYHFDVMIPWKRNGKMVGVLFISLKPNVIARLLRHNQVAGHTLILLRKDIPDLIEVSSQGSRDKIERAIHLTKQELARIGHKKDLVGTGWTLVDLPNAELFRLRKAKINNQMAMILIVVFLISGFMLYLVKKEERKRNVAEQALRDSNEQLEERVKERTDELLKTNKSLQLEISERNRAEKQAQKLSSAVEQTDDSVIITDHTGVIEYVNSAFTKITGYSKEEAVGKKPSIIKSGLHDNKFYQRLWSSLLEGKGHRNVFINRRKDGSLYYEEATITPLKDSNGQVTHFVSTGKNISERIEIQERINYLAHHDILTDLPNRALLLDRLEHALVQAKRNKTLVAVLSLDLDRFKRINDSLGYSIGDKLLKGTGQRLTESVREGDTVSRLGGDEFTVILEGIKEPANAARIAEKILETLAQPWMLDDHEVFVTTSIGITLYPADANTTDDLIQNADTAMYRSKRSGGNSYQFFTADEGPRAMERLDTESALRHALDRQEFVLYYQPLVDIKTGQISGMEALLRWQRPEHGLVMPDRFIPILEESGLIIPVGEWVLRTACKFSQDLQNAGLPPLRVSVNVSPRQFSDQHLLERISGAIKDGGLDPRYLELEITENMLLKNYETTSEILESLHDKGIIISIDDFGTGYSSMSYLKRLPIDVIKIDREFIQDITTDTDDAAIVSAILGMAGNLRLRVVAEGVETNEQLDFLYANHCDQAQGFLFSQAVPAEEFESMVATGFKQNIKVKIGSDG